MIADLHYFASRMDGSPLARARLLTDEGENYCGAEIDRMEAEGLDYDTAVDLALWASREILRTMLGLSHEQVDDEGMDGDILVDAPLARAYEVRLWQEAGGA